jgi:hypothetical protein
MDYKDVQAKKEKARIAFVKGVMILSGIGGAVAEQIYTIIKYSGHLGGWLWIISIMGMFMWGVAFAGLGGFISLILVRLLQITGIF